MQMRPGWSTPAGTRFRMVFSPFTTSVWPALLPPWKRTTTSALAARRSTTFPFPSSPHCVPMMTVAGIRLGVCSGNHGERGERAGERERQAQRRLTRRAGRHAAGGRSEHAARSPRIVRRSHHDYPDGLLALPHVPERAQGPLALGVDAARGGSGPPERDLEPAAVGAEALDPTRPLRHGGLLLGGEIVLLARIGREIVELDTARL